MDDGKLLSAHASIHILGQEQSCPKQPGLCLWQARASYTRWGEECTGEGGGVPFSSLSQGVHLCFLSLLLEREGQGSELHRLQVPVEHLWARKSKPTDKL